MVEEIELVKLLIELTISIIKSRPYTSDQLDKIDQTFSCFNMIHDGYWNSFQEYRKMVVSSEVPLDIKNPILDKIKEDSRFNEDKKAEVLQKMQADMERGGGDTIIEDFISSITFYLLNTRRTRIGLISPLKTQVRTSLLNELNIIFGASDSDIGNWDKTLFLELSGWNPLGGGCPIDSKLLKEELDIRCKNFEIGVNDPEKFKKLKKALAIQSIDDITQEIADKYGNVNKYYLKITK